MRKLVAKIAVKGEARQIFSEVAKWQDSSWWPDIPMKFTRLKSDNKESQIYLQEAKVPLGPKWRTKIGLIDRENLLTRRYFLDGIFQGGFEEVYLENKDSYIEVIYNFYYQINSFLTNFLWVGVFKYLHNRNINRILNSLKKYMEAKS
ncbi:MAG: hypothetical protein JW734_06110 [Candidatus Omnitrophica bacterium]|nr:hypothetical protein [Candidatus Omnitrophota bacterium]